MAVVVREFDLEVVRRVNQNDRSDLAADEALGRNVLREGDDVESSDRTVHDGSPPPGRFQLISTTR